MTGPLERLAEVWRKRVGAPSRQALLALLFATAFSAAHLGRAGTVLTRAVAVGLLIVAVSLLILRAVRETRDWRSARRTIGRVLLPTDASLGRRALRALRLVERADADATVGSPELAKLHFERLLAQASLEAVERSAGRRAARWRWAFGAFAMVASLAFAFGPMRVVEGLNVLVAWKGRAPLPMAWLDLVRVGVHPPAYLHTSDRVTVPGLVDQEPVGSLLTIQGVPRRDGRKLVLTDGDREVSFVSDGAGGVIARWTLDKSARLRIAARFGGVLIEDPEALEVAAIADTGPRVTLESAPKTLPLGEVQRIELRWEAADDHGLRQVDLVLRAGAREERRVLGRFDGESRTERGGHVLYPRDPFIRRTFLPVVVSIEARDDDPISGPKWGKSAAITLVPQPVGEPEAKRYQALALARDKITDLFGEQMLASGKPIPAERLKTTADALRSSVEASNSSIGVPAGLSAFLLGQARLLERAPRPGATAQRKTEDVLLAVDAVLRRLGSRDSRAVAIRLGDVAEEAAEAAKFGRETEKRSSGIERLDAAIAALDRGSAQLLRLGMLGRDLGSVAHADLGRVRRARLADDLMHAELAARHLAARLRRPNPSFGGARSGGVESGVGPAGPSGEPSQADQRFDQLIGELDQLVQEHADQIGGVEQALAEAEKGIDLEGLREEAQRRADALKRAISGLPDVGRRPGSPPAAAALGREHGSAMAQNLERLALDDAVRSGRDALAALEEAERKANELGGVGEWFDPPLDEAKQRIAEELRWSQQMLDKMRQAAEAKARGTLEKSGGRERSLAERAGNLAGRGAEGETALPEDALESLQRAEKVMNEAARALSEGRGEKGLERQREAQRLLERAATGQTGDSEERSGEPEPDAGDESGRIQVGRSRVPKAEQRRSAEEFRRRVLEGLGRESGGRLAPAVRRYAEGLLR